MLGPSTDGGCAHSKQLRRIALGESTLTQQVLRDDSLPVVVRASELTKSCQSPPQSLVNLLVDFTLQTRVSDLVEKRNRVLEALVLSQLADASELLPEFDQALSNVEELKLISLEYGLAWERLPDSVLPMSTGRRTRSTWCALPRLGSLLGLSSVPPRVGAGGRCRWRLRPHRSSWPRLRTGSLRAGVPRSSRWLYQLEEYESRPRLVRGSRIGEVFPAGGAPQAPLA